MFIKKGVKLIDEVEGDGPQIERHSYYLLSTRLTLSRGEVVKVLQGPTSQYRDRYLKLNEDGFLESRTRIDRENLIVGLFYAILGMKVGGYRKVEIAPHLAYQG